MYNILKKRKKKRAPSTQSFSGHQLYRWLFNLLPLRRRWRVGWGPSACRAPCTLWPLPRSEELLLRLLQKQGDSFHCQIYVDTVNCKSASEWGLSFLPAGLTCLKEVAAAMLRALFSSLTSCHAFRASHRLIKPGAPLTTKRGNVKRGWVTLKDRLRRGMAWCEGTCERQSRAQSVDLSGCLVGVHAVSQRQLGHAAAVLPAEVVGYSLIILCCVCEGLHRKQNE